VPILSASLFSLQERLRPSLKTFSSSELPISVPPDITLQRVQVWTVPPFTTGFEDARKGGAEAAAANVVRCLP
jgi:hypothetical protein